VQENQKMRGDRMGGGLKVKYNTYAIQTRFFSGLEFHNSSYWFFRDLAAPSIFPAAAVGFVAGFVSAVRFKVRR
jgi:hypothetical protein